LWLSIIIKRIRDGGYDWVRLALHAPHSARPDGRSYQATPEPSETRPVRKCRPVTFSIGARVMSQLPPDTHDMPRGLSVSKPLVFQTNIRILTWPNNTPENHELAHETRALPPTKPTKLSGMKLTIQHVQTDAASHRTPFATKRRSNKPTSDLNSTPTMAGVQQTHNTTISPSTTTATASVHHQPCIHRGAHKHVLIHFGDYEHRHDYHLFTSRIATRTTSKGTIAISLGPTHVTRPMLRQQLPIATAASSGSTSVRPSASGTR
jgi:hypothetical protein